MTSLQYSAPSFESTATTLACSRSASASHVDDLSNLSLSENHAITSKTNRRLQDAWTRAKKHVECHCSAHQQKIISDAASSKDLMKKLEILEAQQKNRLSLRFAQRVKPFIEAIGLYDNTMKTYCNTGMGELGFVWGSVTLIIDIAGRFIGCFEKLLDIMALLGENLPRIGEYTVLFSDSERIQSVLSLIYEDLLEFCIFAIEFFNKKGIRILWRILWGDFEGKTKQIIKNINRHKVLADDEANALAIKEAKVDREEGAFQHQLFRVREVIKWLSPADMENKLDKLLQERQLGTGTWLLDSPPVKDWLDRQSRVLWVYGIPGCGKSVMCSTLIEHLQEQSPSGNTRVATIYFFCDGKSSAGRDAGDVLRSLIAQLLRQHINCVNYLFEAMIRSGQEKASSLRELLSLFKGVKDHINLDWLRIVIDAWDECEDDKGSSVLRTLIPTADPKTSLFISSRNEPWIRERLDLYPHLEMTAERIQPDIESFIATSLRRPPLCTLCEKGLHGRISDTLRDKAGGQFLWVRLMLENLRKATHLWTIEDILSNLPLGLECAYGRVLERLLDQPLPTQEFVRRMFMWLANAERPLTLAELDSALSIREGNTDFTPADGCLDLKGFIQDNCASLVEISAADKVTKQEHVNFVHVTVREFLTSPSDVWESQPPRVQKFRVCQEESHDHLAAICMTQMKFEKAPSDAVSRHPQQPAEITYPLLQYANTYWATHLTKAGPPDATKCKTLLEFISSDSISRYLDQSASEKTALQSLMVLQSQLNEWIARSKHPGPEVQLIRNCFKNQYEWKIKQDELRFGPQHPKTLTSLYHMATLLHSEGSWDQAEALYQRSLHGRQEVLGLDDPVTLGTAFELATALRRQGRPDQSYEMHNEVLEARRRVLGPTDSATLMSEDEVAQALCEQKQLKAAEEMGRHTLEKKTILYGQHDARTVRTMNLLAAILKDRGLELKAANADADAKAAFQECQQLELVALDARETIYGPEHPETATVCNMLGIVNMLLGSYEESEKWHLRALDTREKVFGPTSPHTQRSMRNLVRLYGAQFKTVETAEMQARLRHSLEGNPVLLKRPSWASWTEENGQGEWEQRKALTW